MATNRSRPVIQSVQLRRESSNSTRRSAPDLDSISGTDVVGQISSVVLLLTEGDVGDAPNERCQRRYALKRTARAKAIAGSPPISGSIPSI